MNLTPRPLVFSDHVENTLAEAASTEVQLAAMRGHYRHGVFTLRLTPSGALRRALTVTAGGGRRDVPPAPESVAILPEVRYHSSEHAVIAMAEFSGLGYEAIPAIRAAWLRAVEAGEESGFDRALELAANRYESRDADLLPQRRF